MLIGKCTPGWGCYAFLQARSHSIPFNLTLTRLPSAQAKLIALSSQI
ncbi:hypothetical protein [Coleofasciculus sp. F4-SAH-05]